MAKTKAKVKDGDYNEENVVGRSDWLNADANQLDAARGTLVDQRQRQRRAKKGGEGTKGTKATKATNGTKGSKKSKTTGGGSGAMRRLVYKTYEETRFNKADLTSIQTIEDIREKLEGPVKMDGNLFTEMPDLLSKQNCEDLVSLLQSKIDITHDSFVLDGLDLSVEDLVSVIGIEKSRKILDFFYSSIGVKAPVSRIFIDAEQNDGSVSHHAHYHVDARTRGHLSSTLLIALNTDDDIKGGELLYLGRDGPVDARRTQGKAIAHSYDALHAVAPHKGLRVTLHIHMNHDPVPKIRNLVEGTALE